MRVVVGVEEEGLKKEDSLEICRLEGLFRSIFEQKFW